MANEQDINRCSLIPIFLMISYMQEPLIFVDAHRSITKK